MRRYMGEVQVPPCSRILGMTVYGCRPHPATLGSRMRGDVRMMIRPGHAEDLSEAPFTGIALDWPR